MSSPNADITQPVVLFDGYCNLCNFWANFLLAADSRHRLKFATQQSAIGIQLLRRYGYEPGESGSVALINQGNLYTNSTAVLKILLLLGGVWKLLYILVLIPRPLRDLVYNFIASNRYRWLGKRDHCRIPSALEREQFLD